MNTGTTIIASMCLAALPAFTCPGQSSQTKTTFQSLTLSGPPAYALTDLGPLTSTTSGPMDINNDAWVAGNSLSSTSTSDPGLTGIWSNGVLIDPPGQVSTAVAVNDIGTLLALDGGSPIVYFPNGSSVTVPSINNAGGRTVGEAMNDNNIVVGGSRINSALRAFMWDGNATINLGVPASIPGATFSEALDINNSAVVVGHAGGGGAGTRPARWANNQWEVLSNPFPSAVNPSGSAQAINESGEIVGAVSNPSGIRQAIYWDSLGNPSIIESPLPATNPVGAALDINEDGTVIGIFSESSAMFDIDTSFVLIDQQVYLLNDIVDEPGWTFNRVRAINDAGQIVGVGKRNGITHSFLLTPVPEPASGILMVAGVSLAIRRRRTRG